MFELQPEGLGSKATRAKWPALAERLQARERKNGGEGGIRTPGTVARTPHFECGAIDHSATSPAVPRIAPG